MAIFPQLSNPGGHIVMMLWGFPLIHVTVPFSVFQNHYTLSKCNCKSINYHNFVEGCVRKHYIKYGGELTSSALKNGNFPSAVKPWWPHCHDVMGIPLNTCNSAILCFSKPLHPFKVQL